MLKFKYKLQLFPLLFAQVEDFLEIIIALGAFSEKHLLASSEWETFLKINQNQIIFMIIIR